SSGLVVLREMLRTVNSGIPVMFFKIKYFYSRFEIRAIYLCGRSNLFTLRVVIATLVSDEKNAYIFFSRNIFEKIQKIL
ncbi:hypothetical protein V7119_03850, partial [Bacillus toyonensis]|uniref:hypothetical protein n=1 Tax=Bacillus toyonensis TaxID=155322 RepID=UPI002FFE71AF